MKNFYLSLAFSFLALSLSAQTVTETVMDYNFNGAMGWWEFSDITPAALQPSFADGKVVIQQDAGFSVTVDGVTDDLRFNIMYAPVTRWTQMFSFQFTNETGDTIAQVYFKSSPGGGLYFLNDGPIGGDSIFATLPDNENLETFTKIGPGPVKDGGWNQTIMLNSFSVVIDVDGGKARAFSSDMNVETDLFNAASSTVKMDVLVNSSSTNASHNLWIDSLVVEKGNFPASVVGVENIDNAITVEANTVNRIGSEFLPMVNEQLSNYTLKVYDLTGKLVFSTNDMNTAWDAAAAEAMYIWNISGTSVNGTAITKSGKVILVK